MNDEPEFDMSRVLAKMDDIRQAKEAELQKLLTDPETFDVAQALADEFLGCLMHLHNFHTAVGELGGSQMQDVFSRIQEDFCKAFKQLTGKELVLEVVRQHRFLEGRRQAGVRNKQLNAAKLLKTIMKGERNES